MMAEASLAEVAMVRGVLDDDVHERQQRSATKRRAARCALGCEPVSTSSGRRDFMGPPVESRRDRKLHGSGILWYCDFTARCGSRCGGADGHRRAVAAARPDARLARTATLVAVVIARSRSWALSPRAREAAEQIEDGFSLAHAPGSRRWADRLGAPDVADPFSQ